MISYSTMATMNVKEIELKSHALLKAATLNEPSETIIRILKDLQERVRPTADLLRSTRIGITVNKLRQHSSREVGSLAIEIVSKWRSEINQQTKARESPVRNVPLDKRTWKTDGVDIKSTSNNVRDNCIGLLYNGLCHNTTESPRLVLLKAIAVEAAAFDLYGSESNPEYRTKIRSLFQNLKNKSNPQLRVSVLSNEVAPSMFVRMSHDQLKSAQRREEDRKFEQENMNKAMVAQPEHSINASLECSSCGQYKVTYTEAQTRSADEPMTVFCTCLNCGKSWKQ
jgi:transcription elongation factor S-II